MMYLVIDSSPVFTEDAADLYVIGVFYNIHDAMLARKAYCERYPEINFTDVGICALKSNQVYFDLPVEYSFVDNFEESEEQLLYHVSSSLDEKPRK